MENMTSQPMTGKKMIMKTNVRKEFFVSCVMIPPLVIIVINTSRRNGYMPGNQNTDLPEASVPE